MKKFVMGFLSVLVLLSGIMLSACTKKEISIELSTTEVTIYTNNPEGDNNKEASITVSLEGSDDGVGVDVLSGNVTTSQITSLRGSSQNYTFTIYAQESGESEVKVYSIEKPSVYSVVHVNAITYPEALNVVDQTDSQGRTNMFVVKGGSKLLDSDLYFTYNPIDTNVDDIVWTFAGNNYAVNDSRTALINGDTGDIMAEIKDGYLYAYTNCTYQELELLASFKRNPSVNKIITFAVIDNSSIKSLTMTSSDKTFDLNDETVAQFNLVRNDPNKSVIEGKISAQTFDKNMTLSLRAYQMRNGTKHYIDDYEDYFYLSNVIREYSNNVCSFTFTVNAFYDDVGKEKLFGDVYVEFVLSYSKYIRSVDTSNISILISTSFVAENITVRSSDYTEILNGRTIDLFSSYSAYGYIVTASVYPEDVELSDKSFYITVTDNLGKMTTDNDYYIKVFDYKSGKQIPFTRIDSSDTWQTSAIENGTKLYLTSGSVSNLSGFDIDFVATSNPTLAKTTVSANLFKITEGQKFAVLYETEEGEFSDYNFDLVNYISTAINDEHEASLKLKIMGLTSEEGLSIESVDASSFSTNLELIDKAVAENIEESYIIVKLTVSTSKDNFSEDFSLRFTHKTGKVTDDFKFFAFAPLQNLSVGIENNANVYEYETSLQNFVVTFGENDVANITNSTTIENESLSKLTLSAGSTVSMKLNYNLATLNSTNNDAGYYFMYLDLEGFKQYCNTLTEEEIEAVFGVASRAELTEEIILTKFKNLTLQENADLFAYFVKADGKYFNYLSGAFSAKNSECFVYVGLIVNGYDKNHDEISLIRFFQFESFYPVTSMRPNYTSIDLISLESLSTTDRNLAYKDIQVTLRLDSAIPTYSEIENFSMELSSGTTAIFDRLNDSEITVDGTINLDKDIIFVQNSYIKISNIRIEGNLLKFGVTALSTNLLSSHKEIINILYQYGSKSKFASITVDILQAQRITQVKWNNSTENGEIYLNLKSQNASDKMFTITSNVSPNSAYDKTLTYYYHALDKEESSLNILTASSSQSFTLTINNNEGGYGYFFILPNDMVKLEQNIRKVIYYTYEETGDGLQATAHYLPLSQINTYYEDLINGTNGYLDYFYDVTGEKVFYKDIILKIKVTIADGSSEATAIAVYTEDELKYYLQKDPSLYYKVMNDLSLSNWSSIASFSGTLFGNDSNVNIKINGESLFSSLSGTVKDLNFTGNVTGSGFVADTVEATGKISNVVVNVYYDASKGCYVPSTVKSDSALYLGAFAGINKGVIEHSYAYGTTVFGKNYVGGIVGQNFGTVDYCGIEFYTFKDGNNLTYNYLQGGRVAGLVGRAERLSTISHSYAYAYNLENSVDSVIYDLDGNQIYMGNIFAGAFDSSVIMSQNFAFLGGFTEDVTPLSTSIYKDSYVTYNFKEDDGNIIKKTIVFDANGKYYTYSLNDISEDGNWANKIGELSLNSDTWVLGEEDAIDSSVNFGFMYLKYVQQSASVSSNQSINAALTAPLKALAVFVKDASGNVTEEKVLLFNYAVTSTINDNAVLSALNSYNTISIADLFGVTQRQARSLLVTVDRPDVISVGANSLKINKTYSSEITLTLYSKMDLSDFKQFKIKVINALPQLITKIGSMEVKDGQLLNLQIGSANSKQMEHVLSEQFFLNGEEYSLVANNYFITTQNDNTDSLSVTPNGAKVVFEGLSAIDKVPVATFVNVEGLSSEYNEAIHSVRRRNINVSTFAGANSVYVDVNNLNFTPSEFETVNVTINTDDEDDDLYLSFLYDGKIYEIANNSTVKLNDNLALDISWTKQCTGSVITAKITINVNRDYRYKVDKTYNDITLQINALSQKDNDAYKKTVALTVNKQDIDDITLNAYTIKSRIAKGSVYYYMPSDSISTTLAPSSDAIISLEISPNFAYMSHFTVTYDVISDGKIGTVGLTKLAYNPLYGYYNNSSNVTTFINGIRVNLTETDKETGVYYFRIYASSEFTANSKIKLTFTFYAGDDILTEPYTYDFVIDYLKSAEVLVNGEYTTILAKGSSANVSIMVDVDQTLDRLYLQGNGSGITLSSITETETQDYRLYTASLNAYVTAVLSDGSSTGSFMVCATVSRYINGLKETKESYATVCLVDFKLDEKNISLPTYGATTTYNNSEYDVFYSYINDEKVLTFNYNLLPNTYNYDANNITEIEKVVQLTEKRNSFLKDGCYADLSAGYYINYNYNSLTGRYEEVKLQNRLYYVNADGSATAIYNGKNFLENSVVKFALKDGAISVTGLQTGKTLLRLVTTVVIGNTTFKYDYDFVVLVDTWADEEVPLPIYTAEEFLKYANGETESTASDFILMKDIVLTNYTPVSTTFLNSLDGNGYTIYINSFTQDNSLEELNLALFDTVTENTTLKNIRVNIYNGGQLTVNINDFKQINIAGFALNNNGVIYNCEVVAFYDENYSSSKIYNDTGLVVKYVEGAGTSPIYLTSNSKVTSLVAGFVLYNNKVITNSRVGGESVGTILTRGETNYYHEFEIPTFTLEGQGQVAGFVHTNAGKISASFADNLQINNFMNSTSCITAGFVLYNSDTVETSYVEGVDSGAGAETNYYFTGSSISSIGTIAGFVYNNSGLVKNSYVNIAIETNVTKSSLSSGFVYRNEADGEVTLCYSSTKMSGSDINEMSFSGIDSVGVDQNLGTISYSYYYNISRIDNTNQSSYDTGAYAITDVDFEESFYRFSFASESGAYDGIWTMAEGNKITLVSANRIAFSNRYLVYNSDNDYSLYYSILQDSVTYRAMDFSYGSINNPIIIRNASDFAKATGKAQELEISSYKQYYSDTKVFGNYRLVGDIDLSEIDQNTSGVNDVRLTTTTKTFTGLLDGNSFMINNIELGSSSNVENFGLFAKLDGATVMNLEMNVVSVHNSSANIVGTLAGTAKDSRLMSISINPTEKKEDDETSVVSIAGYNIVGGLVGLFIGDGKINDITVTDLDVDSGYYSSQKTIETNDMYVGDNLRKSVGGTLRNNVKNVSYAGAVIGYVDIYNEINESNVVYSSILQVTDYDIATIRAFNSVDVYGEVVGGLFGYLGKSTLAYDLGVEVNANMDLSNSSYITSKNLYAGGIVGESYAGLFAVYSQYSDTLQTTIEESMNQYYNLDTVVERGQMSIFSYTTDDVKHYGNRTNEPLFVGGLVGFARGGYISTAYSKLNVVSYSNNTLATGGIVGYVNADVSYNCDLITNKPFVNYTLYQVYYTGHVDNLNGQSNTPSSAGIVGAQSNMASVAMKYVNSIVYYNKEDNKTYALIGKLFDYNSNTNVWNNSGNLIANNYLILSGGNYYDLATGSLNSSSQSQSATIGATKASEEDTYIQLFGFNVTSSVSSQVLKIKSMSDLSTMEMAYASMRSYFLLNGWDSSQWEHEVGVAFPEISFLPKLTVTYLDVWNAEEVVEEMKNNPSITVVVRGEVTQGGGEYQDIDLSQYDSINGFYGTIISYHDYMNDLSQGYVTKEIKDNSGNLIGGKTNDYVGLILDGPLFTNVQAGLTLSGLNIYFKASAEGGSLSADEGGLLVSGSVGKATFENLNIFLNADVNITPLNGNAGIISSVAASTSYSAICFNFRNNATQITVESDSGELNFGLLSGTLTQASESKRMVVEGISLNMPTPTTELNINLKNSIAKLNAGFYFGQVLKNEGTMAKTTFVLNTLSNVKFNLLQGNVQGSLGEANIGGVVGTANIDEISTKEGVDCSLSNITVYQNINIDKLQAGLGFGTLSGSGLATLKMADVSGQLIQGESVTTNEVKIGGFVGYVNGYTLNISASKLAFYTFKEGTYGSGESAIKVLYGQTAQGNGETQTMVDTLTGKLDVYSTYSSETKDKIFAYQVSAGEQNIGSLIGALSGNLTASLSSIVGDIRISDTTTQATTATLATGTQNICVGTVGALLSGGHISWNELSGTSVNKTNYAVETTGDAKIGGLVGSVESAEGANSSAVKDTLNIKNFANLGTVIGDVQKNVVYGGIVGYVDNFNTQTDDKIINISSCVNGGTFRLYNAGGNDVVVGGIVGKFDSEASNSQENQKNYIINSNYTYGDVFVVYSEETSYLTSYVFGGIVGRATKNTEISSNYSLQSSFNDKISNAFNVSNYSVNAIAGLPNNTTVTGNFYSSGVNFAYQEETGNIDAGYFAFDVKDIKYYGYSADNSYSSSDTNIVKEILNQVEKYINSEEVGKIAKLNPICWEGGNLNTAYNDVTGKNMSEVKGVKWFYVEGDVEVSTLNQNLNDVVIVGNGFTISYTINGTNGEKDISSSGDYQGIFGQMGTKDYSFSALSNFVVEAKVLATTKNKLNFGGVVGSMGLCAEQKVSSSIIYGVGVHGEISIGGTGTVDIGGIVGYMRKGLIKNCYTDMDIIYRAGYNTTDNSPTGNVAGIAVTYSASSYIMNTYSGGSLQAYSLASFYAFTNGAKDGSGIIKVYDSYTYTRFFTYDYGKKGISSNFDKFGTASVTNCFDFTDSSDIDNQALGFADFDTSAQVIGFTTKTTSMSDGTTTLVGDYSTYSIWYFSPKTNYGYATHGFGFLKNISVYVKTYNSTNDSESGSTGTQAVSEETSNNDNPSTATYNVYTYTRVGIADLSNASSSTYAYAIPNAGKFTQMTSMAGKHFFLLYDLQISSGWSDVIASSESQIYIDGQNHTITRKGVGPLFGKFYGNIENLKVDGIDIKSTKSNVADKQEEPTIQCFGGIASAVIGNLTNVKATGVMTLGDTSNVLSGQNIVGGVAGYVKGNIINCDNYCIITATGGSNIVGGVVGYIDGNISYSVNNGIIENNSGETKVDLCNISNSNESTLINGDDKITTKIDAYFKDVQNKFVTQEKETKTQDVTFNSITGGVVGYATKQQSGQSEVSALANTASVIVDNCFNNASVLDNYTTEKSVNAVGGGVAGYADSVTNSGNTGLVAVGNTSSEGVALAGGIAGYASLISNSSNEGKVTALSALDSEKYSIEVNKITPDDNIKEGGKVDKGFAGPVTITYTIKYNDYEEPADTTPGGNTEANENSGTVISEETESNSGTKVYRKVFAYGIGYTSNGTSITGNYSTTNNISNDGNLGYIETSVTKTFNTQQFGGDGFTDYGYTGKYEFDTKIKSSTEDNKTILKDNGGNKIVTGYDAYGFPNRLQLNYTYSYNLTDMAITLGAERKEYGNTNMYIWESYDPMGFKINYNGTSFEVGNYLGYDTNNKPVPSPSGFYFTHTALADLPNKWSAWKLSYGTSDQIVDGNDNTVNDLYNGAGHSVSKEAGVGNTIYAGATDLPYYFSTNLYDGSYDSKSSKFDGIDRTYEAFVDRANKYIAPSENSKGYSLSDTSSDETKQAKKSATDRYNDIVKAKEQQNAGNVFNIAGESFVIVNNTTDFSNYLANNRRDVEYIIDLSGYKGDNKTLTGITISNIQLSKVPAIATANTVQTFYKSSSEVNSISEADVKVDSISEADFVKISQTLYFAKNGEPNGTSIQFNLAYNYERKVTLTKNNFSGQEIDVSEWDGLDVLAEDNVSEINLVYDNVEIPVTYSSDENKLSITDNSKVDTLQKAVTDNGGTLDVGISYTETTFATAEANVGGLNSLTVSENAPDITFVNSSNKEFADIYNSDKETVEDKTWTYDFSAFLQGDDKTIGTVDDITEMTFSFNTIESTVAVGLEVSYKEGEWTVDENKLTYYNASASVSDNTLTITSTGSGLSDLVRKLKSDAKIYFTTSSGAQFEANIPDGWILDEDSEFISKTTECSTSETSYRKTEKLTIEEIESALAEKLGVDSVNITISGEGENKKLTTLIKSGELSIALAPQSKITSFSAEANNIVAYIVDGTKTTVDSASQILLPNLTANEIIVNYTTDENTLVLDDKHNSYTVDAKLGDEEIGSYEVFAEYVENGYEIIDVNGTAYSYNYVLTTNYKANNSSVDSAYRNAILTSYYNNNTLVLYSIQYLGGYLENVGQVGLAEYYAPSTGENSADSSYVNVYTEFVGNNGTVGWTGESDENCLNINKNYINYYLLDVVEDDGLKCIYHTGSTFTLTDDENAQEYEYIVFDGTNYYVCSVNGNDYSFTLLTDENLEREEVKQVITSLNLDGQQTLAINKVTSRDIKTVTTDDNYKYISATLNFDFVTDSDYTFICEYIDYNSTKTEDKNIDNAGTVYYYGKNLPVTETLTSANKEVVASASGASYIEESEDDDTKITLTSFGQYEFTISGTGSKNLDSSRSSSTVTLTSAKNPNEGKNDPISMILTSSATVQDEPTIDNKIYGNGNALTVIGKFKEQNDFATLFGDTVSEVKMVLNIDSSTLQQSASAVEFTIDKIKTVDMYGTVRNVGSNIETITASVIGETEQNTFDESSESTGKESSESTGKLYVSMYGLDGQETSIEKSNVYSGANLQISSSDKINATEGKNVFVAGNGGNGVHGPDSTEPGKTGVSALPAGAGGSVTGLSTGINIVGHGGRGGNGGNGADGANVTIKKNINNGGGGGGASTSAGLDGNIKTITIQPNGQVKENISQKVITNLKTVSGTGGNGGAGGLGYMYCRRCNSDGGNYYAFYKGNHEEPKDNYNYGKDWYITSGAGGDAGTEGLDGNQGNKGAKYEPYQDVIFENGSSYEFVSQRGTSPGGSDTTATFGYFWYDGHGEYGDEFLYGNLQIIPALSFDDRFISGGDLKNKNYTYLTYLQGFVKENSTEYKGISKGRKYTDNPLWDYFQGGNGVGTPNGTARIDTSGGYAFTSEIYGWASGTNLSWNFTDKHFLSRNDMVTGCGFYGTATVNNPN